jgi:hypothetical protein
MQLRATTLATVLTLIAALGYAGNQPNNSHKQAPASSISLVSQSMKIVSFNKQTCKKAYQYTFKIQGSGKHTYRFVLMNGGSVGGGRQITLTAGRPATVTAPQWNYTLGSKKNTGGMDIWVGIAFDGGPVQEHMTYHDTCQNP